MEAASIAFVEEFEKEVPDKYIPISIYCGTGNNGGDGLAVARLLYANDYKDIKVKISGFSKRSTQNFDVNRERLKLTDIPVTELSDDIQAEEENSEIIIDALLGSGFNKPVKGKLKELIDYLNSLKRRVISIDVPSGFPSEDNIPVDACIIKASLAISFERPRINFFFPESARSIDRFKVVPIGLDEEYIQSIQGHWKLVAEEDIMDYIKPRKHFSHKGTFGHALIIAGSEETMGAALLCSDACLHSGAGLTTACIPESGNTSLNTRSPEIMSIDNSTLIPYSMLNEFSSIAIGPGLGTADHAADILQHILNCYYKNLVLDADALNILSMKPELIEQVPPMSIITPHMKEFDRLFGEHKSWWDRIVTARKKAAELNIIILLKNQYSFIILPDGNVMINPTGNPAMAVGGMGDVLTGMIAGFLTQGYSAQEAATIACFIHGKAGDELSGEGMNSIPPRNLVKKLPFVIKGLGSSLRSE